MSYDDWKLQTPPEFIEGGEAGPDDEESEFTCCECGEELGVTGACTNEDCAEFDPEEEK